MLNFYPDHKRKPMSLLLNINSTFSLLRNYMSFFYIYKLMNLVFGAGARMKYWLDKSSQDVALSYVTNLNNQMQGVTIQV